MKPLAALHRLAAEPVITAAELGALATAIRNSVRDHRPPTDDELLAIVCRMQDAAVTWRAQERALDELVADAMRDAQLAEAAAYAGTVTRLEPRRARG